jgi:hypothetical protein
LDDLQAAGMTAAVAHLPRMVEIMLNNNRISDYVCRSSHLSLSLVFHAQYTV